MPGIYYVKKFRNSKGEKERTPLFIIKRPKCGKNLLDKFQVRYTNIYKTFDNLQSGLVFVEKLLNNRLDDLNRKDIIISVTHCDEKQEILVVAKGIDSDDAYFFSEKYNINNTSLDDQSEMFVASCCVVWKLFFIKFNTDYRLTLLRRNLIGNSQIFRTSHHFPNRDHVQTKIFTTT